MSTLLGEARVRIRPDTKGFESEARSGISKAVGGLAVLAKRALAGALGVGAIAGGIGLKVAADLEQAKIGFTTMLGSGEKAESFLKKLSDFAAKTPFEFPELQSAASKLIAVGTSADRVLPIMEVLGDSTAAMGTGAEGINRAVLALQQMRVKGKVTGEEMLQLAEAGVPAWEALAKQLGVTTGEAQEMVTKGKVSVDDLFTAIETRQGETLKRTEGMMKEQAKTLSGLWSTVKDTVQMRLAEAMEPVIPFIKKGLEAAGPIIDGALGAVSSGLGKAVSWLETTALPTLREWGPKAKAAIGEILPEIDVAGMLEKARQTLASKGSEIVSGVKQGIENGNWRPLGESLGNAIRQALQNLGDLASDVYTRLKEAFAKVDWIGLGLEVGKQAIPFVVGLAMGILNFDIVGLFQGLGAHWQEALFALLTIMFAPAKIVGWVAKLVAKIPFVGPIMSKILVGLNELGSKVWGWFTGFIGRIGSAFASGGPTIVSRVKGVFETVKTTLYVWADDTVKWFKSLPQRFSDWTGTLADKIGVGLRLVYDKVAGFVSTVFSKGKEIAAGLIRGVVSGDFFKAGADMLAGIGRGLLSIGEKAWSWAVTIKDKIVGAIKSLFGIHSPSRVMADLGGFMVDGLLKGLLSGQAAINALVGKVFGNPVDFVKRQASNLGGLVSQIPGFAEAALKKVPELASSGLAWVKSVIPDDVKRVAGNAWDSIRGALPFDRGGVAPGIGYMPKATLKPERVLSPQQTKAFEEWMRGDHAAQKSIVGGDLVIQAKGDNVREDLEEALFQLRRIRRGGVYA